MLIRKQPDLVTLVDQHDLVQGELDKYQAHRYPAQLHRAVSVWLFRKSGLGRVETLWQKRSPQKIVGAGWWGNTICGNVRPSESSLDCAFRRLKDELTIVDSNLQLQSVFKFTYQAWGNDEYNEHEVDHVLAGWWNGQFQPVLSEVSVAGWVDLQDLQAQVKLALSTPGLAQATEAQSLQLAGQALKAQTQPLTVELKLSGSDQSHQMMLHYWGVRMLVNPRLQRFIST